MVGSRGSWGIQRKAEMLKMYVLSVVQWESRTEGPDAGASHRKREPRQTCKTKLNGIIKQMNVSTMGQYLGVNTQL